MELGFDERGNLKPYKINEISLIEFEATFVNQFISQSTRKDLFHNYRNYLNGIQDLLKNDFFQWIDGSFITQKVNPKDIDFISFIHFEDYKESKEVIEKKFSPQKARELYEVDAYIVPIFPETHPMYFCFQSDKAYWENLFGRTRINRAKKRFEKGIIQINFNK